MSSFSLAYGYGWRNAGDMAINIGSLELLNSFDRAISPRLISIHPTGSGEFNKSKEKLDSRELDYEFLGGPINFDPKNQSKLSQLYYLSGDAIRYMSDFAGFHKVHNNFETKLKESVRSSNFLFYNGGNLIHNKRSVAYLLGVLYPLQLARRYDVPYGILPHTIFGLEGRYSPYIISLLNDAQFVWTREDRSYDYLTESADLTTSVYSGLDTAFFSTDICQEVSENNRTKDPTPSIGFVSRFSTLGAAGYIEGDDKRKLHDFIHNSLVNLNNQGYSVTFVVQTKIEEEWVENNQNFLSSNNIDVFKSYDENELRSFYRSIDMLLTMRLHAGIFALSVGTPSVGIYWKEWGPKIPGTWETIGIGDFVLSWREKNASELLEMTERVLEHREKIQDLIADGISEKKRHISKTIESEIQNYYPDC